MKPLRAILRWLFHITTAVSLILFVCTIALWIRAQFASDMVTFPPAKSVTIFHSLRNGIMLAQAPIIPPLMPGSIPAYKRYAASDPRSFVAQDRINAMNLSDPNAKHIAFLGIHLFADPRYAWNNISTSTPSPSTPAVFVYAVFIPFPWLILFFLLPPATWLAVFGLRRKRDPNLCPHCGYDLRASGDTCPECGATMARQT